jgi:DNA-directed RNA polymerase specialized sigma24 family protein
VTLDLDLLLPAIALGDPDAFERWVAGAEPTLRLSLRSFAATVDTEAVLQEALLRVWQVAPRFVPDGKPHGVVRLGIRIARNLAVSEWRRLRPTDEIGALEGDETALAEVAPPPDPLLRKTIVECKEKLPGKPRLVLEARLEADGTSSDDTLAADLSMQKNTFLQNFTRARKLLAECLRAHGVDVDAVLA